MRLDALGLNAVHAVHRVLQEVTRVPTLPSALRAAAEQACIGYPSLAAVRQGLWSTRPAQVVAWGEALTHARLVLDQLLVLEADADIRDIARWANRHFPSSAQLAGCQTVHVPGRGWTLELPP